MYLTYHTSIPAYCDFAVLFVAARNAPPENEVSGIAAKIRRAVRVSFIESHHVLTRIRVFWPEVLVLLGAPLLGGENPELDFVQRP